MDTKYIQVFFIIGIIISTISCDPKKQFCNDLGQYARIENIAYITPLQTKYIKGDTINIDFKLPSQNNFFGETVDMFEQTMDTESFLEGLNTDYLFDGNEYNVYAGRNDFDSSLNYTFAYIQYEPSTNNYHYGIDIILNRVGHYRIFTNAIGIRLQGNDECNFFQMDTNLAPTSSSGDIEFDVIE